LNTAKPAKFFDDLSFLPKTEALSHMIDGIIALQHSVSLDIASKSEYNIFKMCWT